MAQIDSDLASLALDMMARARDAAQRYLGKSGQGVLDQIERDFPPAERMIGRHEGHFRYGDLPEFAFAVMPFSGEATLLVFGKGRFEGFVLQMPPSLRPVVDVSNASAPGSGDEARALVDCLVTSHRAARRTGMAAAYSSR